MQTNWREQGNSALRGATFCNITAPHVHTRSPKSDFARLFAILSSIRKAKSREKARRDVSEDEGNEMILGSWTFIFVSGKNRAREER